MAGRSPTPTADMASPHRLLRYHVPAKRLAYFLIGVLLYSFVPTQAYHILRDDTAEWVLGVPHSKYKHKNNYYQAVAIYEKAYNKSQIHVTPNCGFLI